MEGFVITGVLEPLNLAWTVDGVVSAIIGIFMHEPLYHDWYGEGVHGCQFQ